MQNGSVFTYNHSKAQVPYGTGNVKFIIYLLFINLWDIINHYTKVFSFAIDNTCIQIFS